MKKVLFNNKGFSLIELMVVVAIIAILASFAIPQYQSFQAKARQKEGLTLLNSFYVAAKATEAEAGIFPGNFTAVGFNPTGQLHYRISSSTAGLAAAPTYWQGPFNASCIVTSTSCGAWTEVTQGSFAANAPHSTCAGAGNPGNGTFNVCASASIRSNAGSDIDTWRINEVKVVTNTNDGIN